MDIARVKSHSRPNVVWRQKISCRPILRYHPPERRPGTRLVSEDQESRIFSGSSGVRPSAYYGDGRQNLKDRLLTCLAKRCSNMWRKQYINACSTTRTRFGCERRWLSRGNWSEFWAEAEVQPLRAKKTANKTRQV